MPGSTASRPAGTAELRGDTPQVLPVRRGPDLVAQRGLRMGEHSGCIGYRFRSCSPASEAKLSKLWPGVRRGRSSPKTRPCLLAIRSNHVRCPHC